MLFLWFFIIQHTTCSATFSNLFLWKHNTQVTSTQQTRQHPAPATYYNKWSLASLHQNTVCAGHCFINFDITEKCCPITKKSAGSLLKWLQIIPFPWCLCAFFLIEVEVCYVQNTLLCRRLFLTSPKCSALLLVVNM